MLLDPLLAGLTTGGLAPDAAVLLTLALGASLPRFVFLGGGRHCLLFVVVLLGGQ